MSSIAAARVPAGGTHRAARERQLRNHPCPAARAALDRQMAAQQRQPLVHAIHPYPLAERAVLRQVARIKAASVVGDGQPQRLASMLQR